MKTIINWKVFFILWVAALLATVFVLPYVLEMQSSAIDLTQLGLPLPVILVLQTLQGAIIFAIAIFLGLLLASRLSENLVSIVFFTAKARRSLRKPFKLRVLSAFAVHIRVLRLETLPKLYSPTSC